MTQKDLLERIYTIIVKAWLEEVLPEEWEEGCICLLYNKNRDQLEYGNY
jgi:hypothetical protein